MLHGELFACVDEYERLKAREGAMDFLDLLLRAETSSATTAGAPTLPARFTRIFVDEFQDTDPLQAELLLLLAADDPDETRWESVTPLPGKLFIVGDPKQSIYRFRRADVEPTARVPATRRPGCDAARTAKELPQRARYSACRERGVRAGHGRQSRRRRRRATWRSSRNAAILRGSRRLSSLPVPAPYSQRFVTARKIEECLPDAVGAYVDWLVRQSGWKVTERRNAERPVPIEARHICILFRRFVSYGEDVTRPYVDALEARGIRHLLVGGRAFHDREEIETLRSALMAIEWPEDQLSVFATLRGGLFAHR